MKGLNRSKLWTRLFAFLLGVVILGALLRTIGWTDLKNAVLAADGVLVALAFAFFIPQIAVMSWRWQLVALSVRKITFREACRMVLAASALNGILPSKLGDICKGFLLDQSPNPNLSRGLGLGILDKILDVLGLSAVLAVAGIFAAKPETWVLAFWVANTAGFTVLVYMLHRAKPLRLPAKPKLLAKLGKVMEAADQVRRRRAIWASALALSFLLWVLHIGQIYVFYRAVNAQSTAWAVFLRVPIGIFVGLLPVTVAGVGTRDAALQVLFAPTDHANIIACLGLFCTLRYVIMVILGLPLVSALSSAIARILAMKRSGEEASASPSDA